MAAYLIESGGFALPFWFWGLGHAWNNLDGLFDTIILSTDRHLFRRSCLRWVRLCCECIGNGEIDGAYEDQIVKLGDPRYRCTSGASSFGSKHSLTLSHTEHLSSLAEAPLLSHSLDTVFTEPSANDFTIPFAALKFGKPIGSGGAGIVYSGFFSGVPVAIKQLMFLEHQVEEGDDEGLAEFRHESSLLAKLRHPNVILLYGICVTAGPFLVMELCAHSLTGYLSSDAKIELCDQIRMARQTAAAIQFLHSKSIAHCDISSENILLTGALDVRLCDFGISRDLLINGSLEASSIKGTPVYIAPEIWYTNSSCFI